MILVLIPTQNEFNLFLESCRASGFVAVEQQIGRLSVQQFEDARVVAALGGLGKVQFAVRTQHLLDQDSSWELVICAGAAGAITAGNKIGDVVVSTETIEHDIRNGFGQPLLPKYPADPVTLEDFRRLSTSEGGFALHFGPVASGDEDVIAVERREDLRRRTAALAVAWEGAGGARACEFSGVPFLELRGISDQADGDAGMSFVENLPVVMGNLAALIFAYASTRSGRAQAEIA